MGDILTAFLAGRNPRMLRAYASDLADFARFFRAPGASAAVELLLSGDRGRANAMALAYKADLLGRGLAASTAVIPHAPLFRCRVCRMNAVFEVLGLKG